KAGDEVDRLPAVHGPNGLARLAEAAFGSGPVRTDSEHTEVDGVVLAARPGPLIHESGPVDKGGRFQVHAIVIDIFDDTHDFAPRIVPAFADAVAEGSAWIAPLLARKILRNDDDVAFLIEVGEGEIASGEKARPPISPEQFQCWQWMDYFRSSTG